MRWSLCVFSGQGIGKYIVFQQITRSGPWEVFDNYTIIVLTTLYSGSTSLKLYDAAWVVSPASLENYTEIIRATNFIYLFAFCIELLVDILKIYQFYPTLSFIS